MSPPAVKLRRAPRLRLAYPNCQPQRPAQLAPVVPPDASLAPPPNYLAGSPAQSRRRPPATPTNRCAASTPHTTGASFQSEEFPAAGAPCLRRAMESPGTLRRPPDPTTSAQPQSSPGCIAAQHQSAVRTCRPAGSGRSFLPPKNRLASRRKNDLRGSDTRAPAYQPANPAPRENSCPVGGRRLRKPAALPREWPVPQTVQESSSLAIPPVSKRSLARSIQRGSRMRLPDSQTLLATGPRKRSFRERPRIRESRADDCRRVTGRDRDIRWSRARLRSARSPCDSRTLTPRSRPRAEQLPLPADRTRAETARPAPRSDRKSTRLNSS